MIQYKLTKVRDYLAENRIDIVALILLADSGNYEPLVAALGERPAWDLLQLARTYGHETKPYPPIEFPIAVSPEGKLTKKTYRLAGLLLSGQEEFLAMQCGVGAEVLPKFELSKEHQVQLDKFYDQITKKAGNAGPDQASLSKVKKENTEGKGI